VKILALELSSSVGSVALRDDDGTRLVRAFPADRKHSGLFYENLRAIYIPAAAPNLIVVGLGPGSYAGVRITLATAFGLRSASGARIVGLPSICAFESAEYVVIGDARRNSFFFAHVIDGQSDEGPTLATEEEIRGKLTEWRHLSILATAPLPQFKNTTLAHPSAMVLAQLAEKLDPKSEWPLEPIYLREPYITGAKK